MQKVSLKRREVVAILEANGFVSLGIPGGGSHERFKGFVKGKTRFADVSVSIEDFNPHKYETLWWLRLQSGLEWEEFYGSDPGVARRAQVPYCPPKTLADA